MFMCSSVMLSLLPEDGPSEFILHTLNAYKLNSIVLVSLSNCKSILLLYRTSVAVARTPLES